MKYFEILYTLGGEQNKIVLESLHKLDAVKKFQEKPLGALLSIDEINEPFSKKIEKLKASFAATRTLYRFLTTTLSHARCRYPYQSLFF